MQLWNEVRSDACLSLMFGAVALALVAVVALGIVNAVTGW